MAIKRYICDADSTITNAFREDLAIRGTGSNMGASDVLEVFMIYAQATTTSHEASRVLMKFPVAGSNSIISDRTDGKIPASGNVEFWLRVYNAEHSDSLPTSYDLRIEAVSASWNEGFGLDMESYKDIGAVNWLTASEGSEWLNPGGDYYSGSTDAAATFAEGNYPSGRAIPHLISHYTASIVEGDENIEIEITRLVEQWIIGSGTAGGIPNYGIGIRLSSSYEDASRSYYTKKFFARDTQYWFKRPCIEARWDDSELDDRGNFFYSSSAAPSYDNLNTIYLYNYVRGQLRNLPAVGTTGSLLVSLYSGSAANTGPDTDRLHIAQGGDCTHADGTNLFATGGYVSTGIYSASFAMTAAATPLTKLFDVWSSGSGAGTNSIQYFTGTIKPVKLDAYDVSPDTEYVTNVPNLKPKYSRKRGTSRFRVFVREKDWNPTIYSKATAKTPPKIIESGSYKITRIADGLPVIPHATASTLYTRLSYDASGSYFDLDLSLLESGYSYAIEFAYYNGAIGNWIEQDEKFKFRVE